MDKDSQQVIYLQSLSEEELINQVLMRLLSKMGLKDVVKYHGGTAEKGKDIVCHYSDMLNQRHYVAIVVKRNNIHGSVGKSGNASEVFYQVEQALNEPFSDIYDVKPADISECWIITSGEIKNTALESIRGKLFKSNLDKITRMIDVYKLISLINEYMPDFWFFDRILLAAAHDMKSQISAARSRATYIAEHPDKPTMAEVKEAAKEISLYMDFLDRLVDMATNLRRQDLLPIFERYRMHDLLLSSISDMKHIFSAKGLHVRLEKDNNLVSLDPILTDKTLFTQVVFNLLHNSLNFKSKKKAEVTVNSTITSEQVAIHFQDYGIGVPNGYEEQIFIEGFRAPNAAKYKGSGIGLGLSISRKIMKQLGGDLILTNRSLPTEFTVYLPLKGKE